jgi:hypothetical protein
MKFYSRASVSEFLTGAHSVIAAAKLDVNNSSNSANTNINKALTTAMTSDAITFRPATAFTTTASDAITFRPATASTTTDSDTITFRPDKAFTATASDCVMVHPKMAVVVVHPAAASIVTTMASYYVAVRSPNAIIVYATKADTKAGPAVDEWVIFYPSDVPTKFVIFVAPLPAFTCQDCTAILAGVVYKVECYFCDIFMEADPKCAKIYFYDPHPCHKLRGAYLWDKCHYYEELVSHRCQCIGCGHYTCHNFIHTMDYMNWWECNITICNNYLKDCTVHCNSCKTTTVKRVGGMPLGTRASVDHINDALHTRTLIVTLAVSMVEVVISQSPSKSKLNCRTARVLWEMVTHILGMVLISEAI